MYKYDKNILDIVSKRDNGIIIGEYTKFTIKSIINFKCSCGILGSKSLLCIVDYGGLYCKKCISKIREAKKQITNLEKYGTLYALQNTHVKNKLKTNLINKYGIENISQLQDIKDKKKIKSLNKFGVEYPLQHEDVKNKRKETNLKKYGVENQFQNEDSKNKSKATNILKYGVEYPSQNQIIFEKAQTNAKKYKKYTMPSGIIRNVQGYEPFALNILITQYTEDQIKTDRNDIPRIIYENNFKTKYYFPDIYIPSENKIIEVKSTWTYKCKKDNIEHKKNACIAQGYLYETWCFSATGKQLQL